MSEILVLVDHVDGTVRKTTNELLTIAKRLGEPSAVYIGSGETPVEALKKFGAEKIYVVDQGLPGGPEGRGSAAAGGEDR